MTRRLAALSICAALGWPMAASAADVTGLWRTETDNGLVDIRPCGDSVCGHLTGSDEIDRRPDLKDSHNRIETQRGRPLKGLLLLHGFIPAAPGGAAWTGGIIYNPDDGHSYAARLNLADGDHLNVKGCFGPFCQTQHWVRVH
jgi:uncharacterized protein (DUF2147 family)